MSKLFIQKEKLEQGIEKQSNNREYNFWTAYVSTYTITQLKSWEV